tara:strand:+ start:284 stop:484 length:201 start_codon:yes stop_codon:yes gene_type:complete
MIDNYLNITSAKYQPIIEGHTKSVAIFIQVKGQAMEWAVPIDDSNTHYQEIKRQVDAGTLTIADAD